MSWQKNSAATDIFLDESVSCTRQPSLLPFVSTESCDVYKGSLVSISRLVSSANDEFPPFSLLIPLAVESSTNLRYVLVIRKKSLILPRVPLIGFTPRDRTNWAEGRSGARVSECLWTRAGLFTSHQADIFFPGQGGWGILKRRRKVYREHRR